MGLVQPAFASSQVLGIPIALVLANRWGWHAPFLMIVTIGLAAGVVIVLRLTPINEHLKIRSTRNPLAHLIATATRSRYVAG